MSTWEISGEAGKALDATKRSFEYLNVVDPVVILASLSADKFTFNQQFQDLADASGMELSQQVTLWRDGVRFFTGNITSRTSSDSTAGYRVQTIVSGPWWWLDNTPISGEVLDDLGNVSDRMQYAYPTGNTKDHITSLIAKMVDVGCPIQLGIIDDMYDIPSITISNQSFAGGVSDLLRWVPDAAVWFDYSVAGHPALSITRRLSASALSLTAGSAPVVSSDLTPRLDLKVEQVRLLFADRDPETQKIIYVTLESGVSGTVVSATSDTVTIQAEAADSDDAYSSLNFVITSGTGAGAQEYFISDYDGETKTATVSPPFTTQPDNTSEYVIGSGSPTSGVPSRQIVPVSGPEVTDFMPPNYYDSILVTSKSAAISNAESMALDTEPKLKEVLKTAMDDGEEASMRTRVTVMSNLIAENGWTYEVPIYPAKMLPIGEEDLHPDNDYYLAQGRIQPWFDRLPLTYQEAKLYLSLQITERVDNAYPQEDEGAFPEPWRVDWKKAAKYLKYQPELGSTDWIHVWYYDLEITVDLVSELWAADTTIWRHQDYGFIHPPQGLAKNMTDAQNWTPFEGSIQLKDTAVGDVNYLSRKINLTNSLPEHAAMGAMVKEVEIDIQGMSTTIELGSDDRLSYKNLVGKFNQQGQDNIVYL